MRKIVTILGLIVLGVSLIIAIFKPSFHWVYKVGKMVAETKERRLVENRANRSVEKVADNTKPINALGKAYLDQGKLDSAQEEFEKTIQANPDDAEAYIYLGEVFFRKQDNRSSLQAFLKAESLGLKDANMFYYIYYNYHLLGEPEQQIPYLEKTLAADPKFGHAYHALAWVYGHRNDKASMMKYLLAGVEQGVDTPYVYIRLSMVYITEGQFQQAIPVLKKYLAIGSDANVLNNLAWCYVCLDTNQEEAVRLAEQAYRMNPGEPHIIHTLSKAYKNLVDKELREQKYIQAYWHYFLSFLTHKPVDFLFVGIIFLVFCFLFFLQFVLQLVLTYSIEEEQVQFLLLGMIPLGTVAYKDIEAIKELKWFGGFSHIICKNWRNRIFGRSVIIVTRHEHLKYIALTPRRPTEFVNRVRAKLDKSKLAAFPDLQIIT